MHGSHLESVIEHTWFEAKMTFKEKAFLAKTEDISEKFQTIFDSTHLVCEKLTMERVKRDDSTAKFGLNQPMQVASGSTWSKNLQLWRSLQVAESIS